jgi:hypothetical protein
MPPGRFDLGIFGLESWPYTHAGLDGAIPICACVAELADLHHHVQLLLVKVEVKA